MQFHFTPTSSLHRQSLEIFALLVENFPQTFFVGGAVRNTLWQKNVDDIDIATIATPDQVAALLQTKNITYHDEHKQFGVITIPTSGGVIEITTFRKDTYTTSRYPSVTFTESILEDAKRRDFTINCVYGNPLTGELLDPEEGLADIRSRIVRTIGDAEQSFTQDPLRMVRALRLQVQYDCTLATEIEHALQHCLPLLKNISVTKIANEIAKIKNIEQENFVHNYIKNS